jgi:hypothetical protein
MGIVRGVAGEIEMREEHKGNTDERGWQGVEFEPSFIRMVFIYANRQAGCVVDFVLCVCRCVGWGSLECGGCRSVTRRITTFEPQWRSREESAPADGKLWQTAIDL